MATKPQELTVERYKFYKTQANPLADGKIAEIFNMNINQLNAFKKENDLIGKFDVRKTRPQDVKVFKGSDLREEEPTAVKPDPPLLKENDIDLNDKAKERALKAIEEYQVNKQLKEKLDSRKIAPEDTLMLVGTENTISKSQPEALPVENFADIKKQLQKEMDDLRKEKAWLEEQHVKDTDEKDELRAQLEKAKQEASYLELITRVSDTVKAERFRQNSLYGHQRHDYGVWLAILTEEFGEVAQAMQTGWGWGKKTDANDLFEELTHVSAVANAFAEQVLEDRMKGVGRGAEQCPTVDAVAAH